MNSLPCEVLEHIYSFLNFYDYLRATEVCRFWNELFTSKISRNGILQLSQRLLTIRNETFYIVLYHFSKASRVYHNIMFNGIDFLSLDRRTELQFVVFLANVGMNVKNIILLDCNIGISKLCQICSVIKQLEILKIDRCSVQYDVLLLPEFLLSFKALKKINIQNLKTENEEIVDFITNGNSAIIDLAINDGYIDERTEIFSNVERLKSLSCTFYHSGSLLNLLSHPKLNLNSLQLQRKPADQFHMYNITNIILAQCNLREFYLNTALTIEMLIEISVNLVCLEVLSITIDGLNPPVCTTITWPNLRVLRMSCVSYIDILLSSMVFRKLEELHIHTERLPKDAMRIIYEKGLDLKNLTLSTLSLLRCEESLGIIGNKLPNLNAIEVHCSTNTDFQAFLRSAETLKRLKTLQFVYCEKITDSTIGSVDMPYLFSFNLSYNRQISNVGLKQMFTKCIRIKHLSLCGCPGVNDDVIEMIAARLPGLENLNISESSEITLNSIRHIINGLRFLT
ncbi:uncharacterized protein LOC128742828 isoform X2 [Sabethes cyaneus]|nr:uncharacterized protein LOC128742828 isoform X2 [Sabethes cyaneus]